MVVKAVIFDMDGVQVTDDLATQTKYMTTKEVTEFWHGRFPWENLDVPKVEQEVVSKVIELIQAEDCTMSGVQTFIKDLKSKKYKIRLATNAPLRVADAVLEKLQIRDLFDTVHSSEFEEQGKPHPAVYLTSARQLGISPEYCIVVEDSHSGLKAAKAAGMKTIVFTNNDESIHSDLADFKILSFESVQLSIL